jgi:adenylate cyclase
MSEKEYDVALLIADISGSTSLYEQAGDAQALHMIAACLDRLRSVVGKEGGMFIRSKGDDVLSAFTNPTDALRAARKMLSQQLTGPLAIHVGLHFGRIIRARGDVFGDAVNTTARLAALAKPGEILVSQNLVEQLPTVDSRVLRVLDHITFKGKMAPTKVYALTREGDASRTEVAINHVAGHTRTQHQHSTPNVELITRYAGQEWSCSEGDTLTIGRAVECDVIVGQPWVSRQHLVLSVQRGKVQIADQSSSGTYVFMTDGYEFFIRRELVLLTGSGVISPAMPPKETQAELIRYEVNRRIDG